MRANEYQTKSLKEFASPAINSSTLEALEDEQNAQTKAIDSEISERVSGLLNQHNTHAQMKFSKYVFNNYRVNDEPFEVYEDRIKLVDKGFAISPKFFKIFIKGNRLNSNTFTPEEITALSAFVDYAGGLERDTRTNL